MIAEMMLYIIERSQDFTKALSQHLEITFISLAISLVLGLLFGVINTRVAWLRKTLLMTANIGRTIPSLAILALALPLLGIGRPPTLLAMVLIGTLPILINTTVGIEQVDNNIKESARGMGMTDLQILLKVEIPISVSVIMAGIRTSAVLLVASATLAAFIGAGGLGDLILRGHALGRDHIILAGAIPATLLAFYFEETFGRLEKYTTPIGLKVGTALAVSKTNLSELLSAVFVMPIIFGILSPWFVSVDAEGKKMILTGLHDPFQTLASIAAILGLIGALFIRTSDEKKMTRVVILKSLLHTVALILLLVLGGILLRDYASISSIDYGYWLHLAGQIALLLVAVFELIKVKDLKVSKTA